MDQPWTTNNGPNQAHHALRAFSSMKLSFKALLLGLLVSSGGAAIAQQTTASTPIQVLDADVSTPGIGSFSGLGTGTMRTATGTTQSLNVGLSSSIAASTSVESTPEYASVGAISAVVTGGDWSQSFGVSSQLTDNSTTTNSGATTTTATTTQVDDFISGNFVGSFDTTTDSTTGNSKSEVDLAGVSSMSIADLSGSSITLDSGARNPTADGTDNGSGSAVGNIATSTTSSASVSTSAFTSGFIQTFSPGTAAATGVEIVE